MVDGTSPQFWYTTPPPLPALPAHLVAKGQELPAIHMVAPKAPEIFFIPLAHVAPLPAQALERRWEAPPPLPTWHPSLPRR